MIILQPVGKYVDINGMLISSSASAITTFDDTTPFGCQRKSWFEVRAGLKGQPTKSLAKGDEVHKQIEHYLTTGQDALGKEARAGKGIIDEMKTHYPVFQIERWLTSFEIAGVKIRGKIDFTGRVVGDPSIKAIVDWKTSSDIQKWGKTSSQLRKDTQMLIYRADAEAEGCDETLPMLHAYFGTVKRESEIVRTTINRQQLADGLGDITSKLSAMKQVMSITDSEEVKPDRKKCGNCPFTLHCPTKGASVFMSSLTDRFKKSAAPVPAPISSPSVPNPDPDPTPTVGMNLTPSSGSDTKRRAIIEDKSTPDATPTAPSSASVLPIDAPKSNPALAADPVPGFEPIPRSLKESPPPPAEHHNAGAVPAESKKRGRPVGAKNAEKAKIDPAATESVLTADDFVVTKVTVNVGATVKAIPNDPKCFEFLRADISLEATVQPGVDIAAVRSKLAKMAQDGLAEEIQKMLPIA